VEQSHVSPAAELDGGCEPRAVLFMVSPDLSFTDQKRRIANPKIEAVAVAELLVAVARPGRVTVEHGEQQGRAMVWLELQPHGGRGQRISSAAARQIAGGDGRPVALQKHGAQVAEEELRIGG